MPTALEGIWMGGPRALTGFDADAGRAIEFGTDGAFDYMQSANNTTTRIRSTVSGAGPDRLAFVTRPGDPDCGAADAGTYTWSISADGQTLTLTADGTDACAVRASAVTGSWELSDCPTADDNCLGTIAPGTHASQFFDPEIGPGEDWTPRYAAITYTVPDGWVNLQDWPDFYELGPAGAAAGTSIFFIRDVVLSTRADLCSDAADPDAGSTPDEVAAALRAPGLTASAPEAVTIGGLAGVRMDVVLEASAASCPYSEGRPAQELFTDRDLAPGFSYGIQGEERRRLYLLEVEPGRTTLVVIQAPTQAAFESFENEATAVVESLTFNP